MKIKGLRRTIALFMALIMVLGTLTGCSDKNKSQSSEESTSRSDEEKETEIFAANVKFNKAGKYTTTVTSQKADLSGITADNIEVRTIVPFSGSDPMTADNEEDNIENNGTDDVKADGADTGAATSLSYEQFYTLTANVDSVTANSDGGFDIAFTDELASKYKSGSYLIVFKDIDNTAFVTVEFPEITLTPDVKSMYASDDGIKVTLTLDGSEFCDEVTEDMVFLDNAFSDMTITSLSCSGKNLTLILQGKPARNVAGAYQWGTIAVMPVAIKDGYTEVCARVNIDLDYAGFDISSLSYSDGRITADIKAYGVVDVNILTKDNISIDGVKIESVNVIDDNTARIIISVEGISSVNDFVDFVNHKQMKLDSYETEIALSQANFYPVFDYVEQDGNYLKLTLKLYIYGGTVDESLNAGSFRFGNAFTNAKVESLSADSDNLVTLVIIVPAGEQNTENFKFYGDITLASGAVTNSWGEKTSTDYTYSREYSGETLGKAVTLNDETLLEIQKYTRGQNTTFGKICYYGGVAGQVYGIVKGVLEMTGVVKSEHDKVMDELKDIKGKVENIQADITDIKKDIKELINTVNKNELKKRVDEFETMLVDFRSSLNDVKSIQKRAALDMALEKAGVAPNYNKIDPEKLDAYVESLCAKYLPDVSSMSNDEGAAYNVAVMNYIDKRAKNSSDKQYHPYDDKVSLLETNFSRVCGLLGMPADSNPVVFYDELCSMTYNFDTQTYNFRKALRATLEYELTEAILALAFHYKVAEDQYNTLYNNRAGEYKKAMDTLAVMQVTGIPASSVKANPHKESKDVRIQDQVYISELLVVGYDDWNSCVRRLTSGGYTPIYKDLNEKAHGLWIMLGYKTTTNYKEAIQEIILYNNYGPNYGNHSQLQLCPYDGNGDMLYSRGDLNKGAKGSKDIFIFYGKDNYHGYQKNTYLTSLWLTEDATANTVPHGSGLNGDLNEGAKGSTDIFLNAGWTNYENGEVFTVLTGKMVDTDPAYYPYCYTLGCKVSAYIAPYGAVDYRSEVTGKFKSWSSYEENEFIRRMHYYDSRDELMSAGIKYEFTATGQKMGFSRPDDLVTTLTSSKGDLKGRIIVDEYGVHRIYERGIDSDFHFNAKQAIGGYMYLIRH